VIAIALAGVVAWYSRQVARRRLRPPAFFLVAVVIHAFLVLGSFYVHLDPGAVPKIQQQFDQIVVNGRISLESMRRLFKPSVETFNQVADLKSSTTENPTAGGYVPAAPGPAMPLNTPISLEPLPRRSMVPRLAAPPDDAMAALDPGLVPRRRTVVELAGEGLLCAQYLGADRNSPRLQAGAKYLLRHLPKKGQQTSYYWYYGAQFMYHMQGDYWTKWNAALRDQLVLSQHKDGPMTGTWDAEDQWEQSGGRLYGTSLRLLMLTVYYRHLPLYQVLER